MAPEIKVSKVPRVSRANNELASASSTSNNDKSSFFPRINRFITEEWKLILSSLVSGVIVFGIVFQAIQLYQNFKIQNEILRERGEVEGELVKWKGKLSEYPNHRDIYFKIATLEYRLGNKDEAKSNLDKALKIDPNFEPARTLEGLL